MKYEFHAQFPLALQDSVTQAAAIDFLAHKRDRPPQAWPELAAVEDEWLRMQLLAQTLPTNYKEQARVGARNDPTGYAFWLERQAEAFLARQRRRLDALNLTPAAQTLPDLALLPAGSFTLSFTFTLASPYLSKDDAALNLLDNPVRKEWVFKLPYIAASQWKGVLQAAMVQAFAVWWQQLKPEEQQNRINQKQLVARRIQLTRLFGTEIEHVKQFLDQLADNAKLAQWYQRYLRRFISTTGFVAGRLYCYPTFFDRLSLEVINPHDRESGAGLQPIYFEDVPAGATGTFTLLYVPFDRIGEDAAETRRQVAADLNLITEGVQAMMTLYGFGAKTSSGFGLAREQTEGEGRFVLNYPDVTLDEHPPRPAAPKPPAQPPALRTYLAEFPNEDFALKPDKWREQRNATNSQREAYKTARAAHADYQQALTQHQQALAGHQADLQAWQIATEKPLPPTTERHFRTYVELQNQAYAVAQMLRQSKRGDA
jgi:CRISPR-associated protein Cmr2